MALAMMVAAVAGCAHGTTTAENQRLDVRGGLRVGRQARALLVGPSALVHATGEKPVRWFLADRVNGNDLDCANPAAAVALQESVRAQITVGSAHVLCAAVANGATDVMWHQFPERDDRKWALR